MLILEIVVYKIIDKIIYYISLFLCMKKREVIFIVVIIVCILLFFKYHEVPQLAPAGECGDCEEWGNDVCGGGSCASNEMHLVRYCEDMDVEDPDLPVPQLSPKFGPADLCTNMCKPLASCNSLPEFSNLFPDNVIISPIDVILSWDIYDLDNDNLTFDVYFNDTLVSTQNETSYIIGDLDYGNEYSWYVTVRDLYDEIIGPVVVFFTETLNIAPNITLIHPLNNSVVFVNVSLNWSGSDIDGDDLIFEVYFDDFLVSTQNEINYSLIELDYSSNHSWYVVVDDGNISIFSDVYYFSVEDEAIEIVEDQPSPGGSGPSSSLVDLKQCSTGCFVEWVGDGECDTICNVDDCTFDGGDCKEEEYALFDIKVFLDDQFSKVLPGEIVNANIIMYNFGTLRPVDVFLKCAIEDFEDERNVLDVFEETLAVAVQISIDRELKVPEDITPGKYTYNCYMDYTGGTVYSSELFEVVYLPEEREVSSGFSYTFVIMLFVIIALIAFIITFVKRKK